MNATLSRWTFKRRLLHIYAPGLLAALLLLGTDFGIWNRMTIFEVIILYLEGFVTCYVVCLLTYALAFHTSYFLRWFLKGMKEK